MLSEWLKMLGDCTLFQRISKEELDIMLECLKPKISNYKKNEYITIAGDQFAGVGIVLSGNTAVTKENAAGNRIIMSLLGPADVFGEMAAFSGNKLWPATVAAMTDCTVMFLPPDKIVGACHKQCMSHRMLIMNMLRMISTKAILLNRKVEYLSIKSIRGRISTYLLEQYMRTGKTTFMMSLKRNELADFLNVSRPSLSREMCRMRDEGIIEFHKSSVRIKHIDALKEIIE